MKVDVTNPKNWETFAAAVTRANAPITHTDDQPGIGIGFVLKSDHAITAVDFDHVLDADGHLLEDYREIVSGVKTYVEVSPSGDGLHAIFLGGKPEGATRCRRGQADGTCVEIYDEKRFITITGNVFTDGNGVVHDKLAEDPDSLGAIYDRWVRPEGNGTEASTEGGQDSEAYPPLSDGDVETLMRFSKKKERIAKLQEGDTSSYANDSSSADMAHLNYLAYYTRKDPDQMERLHRKSRLARDKLDEPRGKYGEMTIQKAIDGTKQVYRGGPPAIFEETPPTTDVEVSVDPWSNPHLIPRHNSKGELVGFAEPDLPTTVWWMEHDEALSEISLDTMTNKICIGPNGLPWNPRARVWTDADDAQLFNYMQTKYRLKDGAIIRNDRLLQKALTVLVADRRRDSLIETLEALPQWDETPRVNTLLVDAVGAEDDELTRAATWLMLRGALARAYRPGCKFDEMVILQGPQGIRKSTLVRKLALRDDFFLDDLKVVGTKEAQEQIRGKWFVEVAELSAFRNRDHEVLKSFLSRQEDEYRVPYAKHKSTFARRCVFVGTTNSETFLHDPTGNRRYIPIPCYGNGSLDLFSEDATDHIKQVWAEALEDFKENPNRPLVLPPKVIPLVESRRADAESEDPWIDKIVKYLERRETGECLSNQEILEGTFGLEAKGMTKTDTARCSDIVRSYCPDWERSPKGKMKTCGDGKRQRFWTKVR